MSKRVKEPAAASEKGFFCWDCGYQTFQPLSSCPECSKEKNTAK